MLFSNCISSKSYGGADGLLASIISYYLFINILLIFRNYHKDTDKTVSKGCDEKCRKKLLCRLVTSNIADRNRCNQIDRQISRDLPIMMRYERYAWFSLSNMNKIDIRRVPFVFYAFRLRVLNGLCVSWCFNFLASELLRLSKALVSYGCAAVLIVLCIYTNFLTVHLKSIPFTYVNVEY